MVKKYIKLYKKGKVDITNLLLIVCKEVTDPLSIHEIMERDFLSSYEAKKENRKVYKYLKENRLLDILKKRLIEEIKTINQEHPEMGLFCNRVWARQILDFLNKKDLI